MESDRVGQSGISPNHLLASWLSFWEPQIFQERAKQPNSQRTNPITLVRVWPFSKWARQSKAKTLSHQPRNALQFKWSHLKINTPEAKRGKGKTNPQNERSGGPGNTQALPLEKELSAISGCGERETIFSSGVSPLLGNPISSGHP